MANPIETFSPAELLKKPYKLDLDELVPCGPDHVNSCRQYGKEFADRLTVFLHQICQGLSGRERMPMPIPLPDKIRNAPARFFMINYSSMHYAQHESERDMTLEIAKSLVKGLKTCKTAIFEKEYLQYNSTDAQKYAAWVDEMRKVFTDNATFPFPPTLDVNLNKSSVIRFIRLCLSICFAVRPENEVADFRSKNKPLLSKLTFVNDVWFTKSKLFDPLSGQFSIKMFKSKFDPFDSDLPQFKYVKGSESDLDVSNSSAAIGVVDSFQGVEDILRGAKIAPKPQPQKKPPPTQKSASDALSFKKQPSTSSSSSKSATSSSSSSKGKDTTQKKSTNDSGSKSTKRPGPPRPPPGLSYHELMMQAQMNIMQNKSLATAMDEAPKVVKPPEPPAFIPGPTSRNKSSTTISNHSSSNSNRHSASANTHSGRPAAAAHSAGRPTSGHSATKSSSTSSTIRSTTSHSSGRSAPTQSTDRSISAHSSGRSAPANSTGQSTRASSGIVYLRERPLPRPKSDCKLSELYAHAPSLSHMPSYRMLNRGSKSSGHKSSENLTSAPKAAIDNARNDESSFHKVSDLCAYAPSLSHMPSYRMLNRGSKSHNSGSKIPGNYASMTEYYNAKKGKKSSKPTKEDPPPPPPPPPAVNNGPKNLTEYARMRMQGKLPSFSEMHSARNRDLPPAPEPKRQKERNGDRRMDDDRHEDFRRNDHRRDREFDNYRRRDEHPAAKRRRYESEDEDEYEDDFVVDDDDVDNRTRAELDRVLGKYTRSTKDDWRRNEQMISLNGMEAGYSAIRYEESRSARIGREEDRREEMRGARGL